MKKVNEKGDWVKHEGLGKKKKRYFWKETVQQEKKERTN